MTATEIVSRIIEMHKDHEDSEVTERMKMKMNWELYTPQLLDTAIRYDNLDEALGYIMDVIDPEETSDLGGEAAIWFGSETETLWPETPKHKRLMLLTEFFNRMM